MGFYLTLVVVAVILLAMMVKIIPQNERALVYRLGRRIAPPVGPGLILIIPVLDKVIRISPDLAILEVPTVEFFTADGKNVRVDCEVFLKKDWPGPDPPADLARHFQELARSELARLTLAELQARIGTNDPGLQGDVSSRAQTAEPRKVELIIKEVYPAGT